MEHYNSSTKQKIKDFIELLNSLGLTVVYINSEFYSSNEFNTPDENSGINESEVFGKDITTLVERSLDNRSVSEQRKREIQQLILDMKTVKRRFHKDIRYVVYSSSY